MSGRITEAAVIVANHDVMACELSDGAALLNLQTGTYYGLNLVGSEVWRHIAQRRRFADLRDYIVQRFVVDSDQCGRDLAALVEKLVAAQLVEIVNAEDLQISGAGPTR